MKLYAFSDFHLSGDPPTKPMDIFGENWKNHREKIIESWTSTIQPEDTVIMAGDLSWATHLPDALNDLKMLSSLPGRKIIVRGNHDYWWDTVTKMKRMTNNALNSFITMHYRSMISPWLEPEAGFRKHPGNLQKTIRRLSFVKKAVWNGVCRKQKS